METALGAMFVFLLVATIVAAVVLVVAAGVVVWGIGAELKERFLD